MIMIKLIIIIILMNKFNLKISIIMKDSYLNLKKILQILHLMLKKSQKYSKANHLLKSI
jgi:hypothetical protein